MKYLYALISGVCLFILIFGCAQKRETIFTVETLIPRDTIVYDTVVVDTAQDTINLYGTKDSLVSDTAVTIVPKSNSINWLIIKTSIVYDTTFKMWTIVESLTIKMEIYEKLIHDTITITNNNMDDKDTISDTIIMGVDSLYEKTIIYTYPGKDSVLYTVIDTPDTIVDTLFVNKYLITTTADTLLDTGNVSFAAIDWVFLDTIFSEGRDVYPLSTCSRVFTYGNSVYIINGSGNLACFNSPVISAGPPVYDKKVDTAAGFHDISFANETKAFITQYKKSNVLIINPATGVSTGSIDLAEYGMDAGTPTPELPYLQCSKFYNDVLYVLCQRLKLEEGGVPVADSLPGLIVAVSNVTDSVDTISLLRKKPVSMDILSGYLYIAAVDSLTGLGGVEKVDLVSGTNSVDVLEISDIANDISSITMVSETKGYLLIRTKQGGGTTLFEFNPSTGSIGSEIVGIEDAAGGMVYDGQYLYVGDRSTTNPGVVIVNPVDNSKVAGPVKTGLYPPSSVSVMTVSR